MPNRPNKINQKNLYSICQEIKKVEGKTFTLTGGAKFRIADKHRNINTSRRVSKDLLIQMILFGTPINQEAVEKKSDVLDVHHFLYFHG